jgi:cytosine/adenosine deaminase-related metal-dependent hydrolase
VQPVIFLGICCDASNQKKVELDWESMRGIMNYISRRHLIGNAAFVGAGLAAPSSLKAQGSTQATDEIVRSLPARNEIILRGAVVMTMDPALGDIKNAEVHIKDGKIVAVGTGLKSASAVTIGGSDMIILPGLVETHWHMWNTMLRGFSGDKHEESYFPMIKAIGKYWRPEASYLGTMLSAAEALNSGITTVHNWSHMLPTPAHADADLRAFADSGLRGRFSYGWSPSLPETETLPLDDIERLHKQWDKFSNGNLIHLGLAWRGMWRLGKYLPESTYRREFEFAQHLGIPLAIHVPGVRNSPEVIKLHAQQNFISSDVLIAHATWATADEIRILADTHTSVSLSPVADARVGYGFPPTSELIDAGVNCCLSIDSTVVTGTCSLLDNAKYAVNLENGRFGSEYKMLPRKALELATINGAKALGLADRVGSISVGKRADVIMVSTRAANMGLLSDPAHLLVEAGGPENVDTVVVDGRVLKQGGKLTHIEVNNLTGKTSQEFNSLRQQANWRM